MRKARPDRLDSALRALVQFVVDCGQQLLLRRSLKRQLFGLSIRFTRVLTAIASEGLAILRYRYSLIRWPSVM
jgi:hypothetical protein